MSRVKTNTFSIKEYSTNLPNKSGIYQMFDINNKCLYVGKAKDLKKRVSSYTKTSNLSIRINTMVMRTKSMHYIITNSEAEALLLESNLIKALQPKYNILLRDDKTFPYINISLDHIYPRISKIRTKNPNCTNLFGPFVNSQHLDEIISLIQKTFKLRVCSDTSFSNRITPCIYYQINRCSAPCVSKVTQLNYKNNVTQAVEFLKGNTESLKKTIQDQMEAFSKESNFEQAIICRDKLRILATLSSNFSIILPKSINADFITTVQSNNTTCIQIILFKQGKSTGIYHFFPQHSTEDTLEDIVANFIINFYQKKQIPAIIYTNILPTNKDIVLKALHLISNSSNTRITLPNKPVNNVISFANNNAQIALEQELIKNHVWKTNLTQLEQILHTRPIDRVEVYDNSHFKGANMLGVMVVASKEGFNKKEYRTFKLKDLSKSEDDYGTLREVLTRRFSNFTILPSLVVIDGGKNHLKIATSVIKTLKLSDKVAVISVSKDENRTFGNEIIWFNQQCLTNLNKETLNFILKLRDEAHRFAITTQRKLSLKNSTTSILDNIPGVGKATKKKLLSHFQSINTIKESSPEHISSTAKISLNLAKKILEWLE